MEGAQVAGQEVGRNIIQIIPRRSSRADGIGDYGTQLAEAMLERAGYNSVFVSGTPERMEPPRWTAGKRIPWSSDQAAD